MHPTDLARVRALLVTLADSRLCPLTAVDEALAYVERAKRELLDARAAIVRRMEQEARVVVGEDDGEAEA